MRILRVLLAVGMMTAAQLPGCAGDPPTDAPEDSIVEGHPRTLVIGSPARAAFIEASNQPVVVRGKGATAALTVNGEPADVAPDGSFRAQITPKVGLNVVVLADG